MELDDKTLADAICDERNDSLYHAHLADETNKELASLLRWHQGGRYRSVTGYACDECKTRTMWILAKCRKS